MIRENVLSGNCPFWELSIGELLVREMSSGNCPSGKIPSRKCPSGTVRLLINTVSTRKNKLWQVNAVMPTINQAAKIFQLLPLGQNNSRSVYGRTLIFHTDFYEVILHNEQTNLFITVCTLSVTVLQSHYSQINTFHLIVFL